MKPILLIILFATIIPAFTSTMEQEEHQKQITEKQAEEKIPSKITIHLNDGTTIIDHSPLLILERYSKTIKNFLKIMPGKELPKELFLPNISKKDFDELLNMVINYELPNITKGKAETIKKVGKLSLEKLINFINASDYLELSNLPDILAQELASRALSVNNLGEIQKNSDFFESKGLNTITSSKVAQALIRKEEFIHAASYFLNQSWKLAKQIPSIHPDSNPTSIVISPDNNFSYWANQKGKIAVIDLSTKKQIKLIDVTDRPIRSLQVSNSGLYLASLTNSSIQVINLKNDAKIEIKPIGQPQFITNTTSIFFSTDDNYLIYNQDQAIIIWDIIQNKIFKKHDIQDPNNTIGSFALSKNNILYISYLPSQEMYESRSINNFKLISTNPTKYEVQQLFLNQSNQFLALIEQKNVEIQDLRNKNSNMLSWKQKESPSSVCFYPIGNFISVVHTQGIIIYDLFEPRAIIELKTKQTYNKCVFTHDGKLMITFDTFAGTEESIWDTSSVAETFKQFNNLTLEQALLLYLIKDRGIKYVRASKPLKEILNTLPDPFKQIVSKLEE